MKERVDTRGSSLEPGSYTFTIISLPIKGDYDVDKGRPAAGKNYYDFEFAAKVGADMVPWKEKIPVWVVAPLLRAIGVRESEPEVFEWERESSIGATFKGEIVSQLGKDGKNYRHLVNPVAIEGFPKTSIKKNDYSGEEVPF